MAFHAITGRIVGTLLARGYASRPIRPGDPLILTDTGRALLAEWDKKYPQ